MRLKQTHRYNWNSVTMNQSEGLRPGVRLVCSDKFSWIPSCFLTANRTEPSRLKKSIANLANFPTVRCINMSMFLYTSMIPCRVSESSISYHSSDLLIDKLVTLTIILNILLLCSPRWVTWTPPDNMTRLAFIKSSQNVSDFGDKWVIFNFCPNLAQWAFKTDVLRGTDWSHLVTDPISYRVD